MIISLVNGYKRGYFRWWMSGQLEDVVDGGQLTGKNNLEEMTDLEIRR